ncbi:MAG: nitroreductase family protein [Candidatus Omnitrophota bacterium]
MKSDFWEVLKDRRSVRHFTNEAVSDEAVLKILKAAAIAPSGSNQKNWEFIVVRDALLKDRLRRIVADRITEMAATMSSPAAQASFNNYAKYFTFFSSAPVVIAVVMRPHDSITARILRRYFEAGVFEQYAGVQSVSAAVQNMLLACTALGLGACWMTGPLIAKKGLEEALSVEAPRQLAALIPVGVPKITPKPNEFPATVENFVRFI